MVDANDLIQGKSQESILKLATVTELFTNGTAKITFFGEETASEKGYSYLASYEPSSNDIVITLAIADTFIILGKVLSVEDVPRDYVERSELNDAVQGVVKTNDLTAALNDYLKTVDANNLYAPKSHTHTGFASQDDLEDYTGWDNVKQTMNNYSNQNNIFSNMQIGNLQHTGYLGFFSKTPVTKLTINKFPEVGTTSISTVINYINQIIDLLARYGLT